MQTRGYEMQTHGFTTRASLVNVGNTASITSLVQHVQVLCHVNVDCFSKLFIQHENTL